VTILAESVECPRGDEDTAGAATDG
jgi:hypothetical protein